MATPLQIDFTQADEFEPLPKGHYAITVESWEEKEGAKAPYAFMRYVVSDGEFTGRKLVDFLSYSTAAQFKIRNFVRAALDDTAPTGTSEAIDFDDFIGKELIVELVIETIKGGDRDGELRNSIKKYHPMSEYDNLPVG